MREYKIEVWLTAICFIFIAVTGGFLSAFFVLANPVFFDAVAPPPGVPVDTFFLVKDYVMGFPLHYLLLIVFSWLGATVIGCVWSLTIDRLEEKESM